MAEIKRLNDHLINKIAAGEVVDRPLAIVRELVENSIDAGAGRIRVDIERGGRKIVRVSDDGSGIGADSLSLAFERHSTSKIEDDDDLNCISSLGFRGEALSSISSVSKLRITTRRPSDEMRTWWVLSAGQLAEQGQESGSAGTTIEVSNLFFNTPVRKKFLKSERYEKTVIKRWLRATALAWPNLGFEFFSDGKEEFCFSRGQSFSERSKQEFGEDSLVFAHERGDIQIEAALSHPSKAGRDRSSLSVIVNGRLVQEPMLVRAVCDGFGGLLRERYVPKGVFCLQLESDLVDINVHPQKSEVRFHEPGMLFSLVRKVVAERVNAALSHSQLSSDSKNENAVDTLLRAGETQAPRNTGRTEQSSLALSSRGLFASSSNSERTTSEALVLQSEAMEQAPSSNSMSEDLHSLSSSRYIGCLFSCYLLFESAEEFLVFDMHAAHERVNYNKIRSRLDCGQRAEVERLLFPLILAISDQQMSFFKEHSELFHDLGFEIEAFADGELIVREVPSFLPERERTEALEEMLMVKEGYELGAVIDTIKDRICSELACRASVRSGDKIGREEAYALIEQVEEAHAGLSCPHGRPVLSRFDQRQIEQWFARHSYG